MQIFLRKYMLGFYTKYNKKGASTRFRTLQYIPYLKKRNKSFYINSLFSDNYLNLKYSRNKFFIIELVLNYLKRFILLVFRKKTSIFIIEKELFPYLPFIFEYLLFLGNKKYILDFDDAVFHNYDLSSKPFIRSFLGKKISSLIKHASGVITGSPYLEKYAEKYNDNVMFLPTVVDVMRYAPAGSEKALINNKITIGWIGSPSTSKYLENIADILLTLITNYDIRIKLIGFIKPSNHMLYDNEAVEIIEWSEKEEVNLINGFDLGIMPLNRTPWEEGKCGFKIIQYMACSKPVVAERFGANIEIVEHGVNGFLAENSGEWLDFLERLIKDVKLRSKMGIVNRRKVVEKYSLQVCQEKYLKFIDDGMEALNTD